MSEESSDQLAQQLNVLSFKESRNRNITFHGKGDKTVGKLSWDDDVLTFEGDATESARIFFEAFGDHMRKDND